MLVPNHTCLPACLLAHTTLQVLNKYYPPDFDPAEMPKRKRPKTNDMKVRMMLPMTVQCRTCGHFMYKGTKFNTKKEDVLGQDYLGIQVRLQRGEHFIAALHQLHSFPVC
jgi:hypothetical protein